MLKGLRRPGRSASRILAPRPKVALSSEDYNFRATECVRKAREKLKVCSDLPESASIQQILNAQTKIGGPESTGVIIRIASAELDADGNITQDALLNLQRTGEDVLDQMANMTLNWSVLFSLLLGMYVSMAILHTGNPAYPPVDAAHWAFDDLAWTDLASYAWPDDEEAAASLRRGLYIGECVTVCLSILMCIVGLMFILILYTSFGAALPDVPAKLDFMLSNPYHCSAMWGLFDWLMFLVPISLGFVTARSSAVLSLTCFATFGLLFIILGLLTKIGVPGRLILAQQAHTRRVMKKVQQEDANLVHPPRCACGCACVCVPATALPTAEA